MNQNNQNSQNNPSTQNTQNTPKIQNTQSTQSTQNPPYTFLPKHGHYRHLRVYQVTEMIYDITYYFTQHYLQRGFIMKKELIVIIAICFCNLITSCSGTEFLTPDNCYTCGHVIYSNEEYSEEEFGYKKRLQDSSIAEMKRTHPELSASVSRKGLFRVKEIWREFDVAVFFLEDISKPMDVSRVKQVISLVDKSTYKGEVLKVGKEYYFELSPLCPFDITPSYDGLYVEELLFENRWLLIQLHSGDNIYSSVNLNGDKYIKTTHGE